MISGAALQEVPTVRSFVKPVFHRLVWLQIDTPMLSILEKPSTYFSRKPRKKEMLAGAVCGWYQHRVCWVPAACLGVVPPQHVSEDPAACSCVIRNKVPAWVSRKRYFKFRLVFGVTCDSFRVVANSDLWKEKWEGSNLSERVIYLSGGKNVCKREWNGRFAEPAGMDWERNKISRWRFETFSRHNEWKRVVLATCNRLQFPGEGRNKFMYGKQCAQGGQCASHAFLRLHAVRFTLMSCATGEHEPDDKRMEWPKGPKCSSLMMHNKQ